MKKANAESTKKVVQPPTRSQQPVRTKRSKGKNQFDRMVNLLRTAHPKLFVD